MVFVSAKEGPPNYGPKEPYTVQYFDEHGNMTIKSGGTKTWRNNNVGNLKYFKKGNTRNLYKTPLISKKKHLKLRIFPVRSLIFLL